MCSGRAVAHCREIHPGIDLPEDPVTTEITVTRPLATGRVRTISPAGGVDVRDCVRGAQICADSGSAVPETILSA